MRRASVLALRLKLIGAVLVFGAAVLTGLTVVAFAVAVAVAVYNLTPLDRHISLVLDAWGRPVEHDYDMRLAAEAALTYGCQTAGLYPSYGFDYGDRLRIRFLTQPEWPDKRDIWVEINEVGRPYVARLNADQQATICREIRERATQAGY